VTLSILREYRGRILGGVMHCFDGSPTRPRLSGPGFLSVFFRAPHLPQGRAVAEVAKKVPLTESSWRPTVPICPPTLAGKRNEPAYVVATAKSWPISGV